MHQGASRVLQRLTTRPERGINLEIYMTLYQALLEAGVECSNYYSDLYFPANDKSKEVLKRFPRVYRTMFTSNITKELMYEAPFAFDPYWETNDE